MVTEEIPLSDIKLRLQGLPHISQERRTCIGSFDASFDEMCERVEALSRSQVGLSFTKERHAIRVNAIEQDRVEQDRKNGRGLARGARYPNHFGENDQRAKGGKGWGRRNGRGDYECRPTEWRSGNNNTPTEWRSGNNNTHRDGRRPNHAHGGNRGRFFMEDRCTWDQCRGKPSHSRRDCPEEARKACTRLQCRGLLHFRNQCPNARGGQLASGDRTQSNPQVNVLSRNQQLAQQMEQHYQQAGNGVRMDFAPHNRQ